MKESIFKPMTMEEIKAEADSLNCEVVVAAQTQLQFDLDDDQAYGIFQQFFYTKLEPHWPEFPAWKGNHPFVEWRSKSGNRHVVVEMPEPLPVQERIALQAMGGSDPGREFAALNCFWAGSVHPILLYKPKTTIGGHCAKNHQS